MSPIATLNHTPHTTSPCSLLAVTEQHLRVGGPLLRGRLSRALPFLERELEEDLGPGGALRELAAESAWLLPRVERCYRERHELLHELTRLYDQLVWGEGRARCRRLAERVRAHRHRVEQLSLDATHRDLGGEG